MLNHWILLLTNYEGLGPPPDSSVITQEDGGFLLQEDGGQIWTDAPMLLSKTIESLQD